MNYFKIINKKQIAVIAICTMIVFAIFATAVSGAGFASVSATRKKVPIYSVGRAENDKIISISFDAAWGNEDTQLLIDILGKYDVKATFFLVGEWVDKYPQSVKDLYAAGHEIMNHSSTHPHMSKLSREQILKELNECNDKIETLIGVRPILFRAPYGEYNDLLLDTAESIGMYTIQWDVDSLDWKNPTSSEIAQRVINRVEPGSIVLFHNAATNTPGALPTIIETLLAEGYTFVPISENIYKDNYKIDVAGKQWPLKNSISDSDT